MGAWSNYDIGGNRALQLETTAIQNLFITLVCLFVAYAGEGVVVPLGVDPVHAAQSREGIMRHSQRKAQKRDRLNPQTMIFGPPAKLESTMNNIAPLLVVASAAIALLLGLLHLLYTFSSPGCYPRP